MLRLFAMLACMTASLSAVADESAWLALEKAAHAARELNYDGQFVYQNGKQMRTVEIRHMYHNGRQFARNMVLDASPREVYAEDQDIVIFQSNKDSVKIEKRHGQNLFPAMLPTDLTLIKASYKAKNGALDYVAGRPAQIINLKPKDAFRYSYRIWTDAEFGLLVKMAMLNKRKEVLEQIYFNRLSMLNSQNLNWFQPKIDVSKRYEMDDATTAEHVNEDWIVADLPAGYRQVDHMKHKVPGKNIERNQLIFSDGIASVSLFIEPLVKGKRAKKGDMPMGSTNMCAHVVDGYQVIVVGEVPVKAVRKIANAVRFKQQAKAEKSQSFFFD